MVLMLSPLTFSYAQDDRTVNQKMAWAFQGENATSSVIFIRGKRYTTIAAISYDGVLSHRTVEGGATTDIFMDYFVYDVVSCRAAGLPMQEEA